MLPINVIAVFAAAVAAFIIGFLMHGPVGGKLWMKLADIHPKGEPSFSGMVPQMVWNFVVNFVTAYALAVVYVFASASPYASSSALMTGITCGLVVWLGFLATSSSIEVIWMGKSFKLWLFEFGSSFLVMVAMGAIIAVLN